MTRDKIYLGDSVYAEINDGVLRLWTDNGYGPENAIFLEPAVISELQRYAMPGSWASLSSIKMACEALRANGPAEALATLEAALRP